ncbi:MAG: matrixin family metalloprotease [Ruminococcus sp.]
MKKIHKIVILFLVLVMILLSVTTVNCYSLIGCKNKSSKVYYYYDNFNSVRFKNFIVKGGNAWNNANVDAKLYPKYAKGIVCSETSNANVGWDGLSYCTWDKNKIFVSQSILINKAKPAWNSDGALKSVIVHEFGHQLGLGDLHLGNKAVMNGYTYGDNSRYGGYKINKPTTDDKNGVNKIY